MYEIDKSIKSFAVANDFVVQTNKACYQLGVQLLPFCIFANAKQKEYNVLDIATFSGMFDSNVSLVKEIADFRKQQYVTSGVYLPDSIDKTLFYDYLRISFIEKSVLVVCSLFNTAAYIFIVECLVFFYIMDINLILDMTCKYFIGSLHPCLSGRFVINFIFCSFF